MYINKKTLTVFSVLLLSIMAFAATWRGMNIVSSTINSSTIGATTPSSGIFTTMQVNSGLANNGGGIKHIRYTSCTTAASAGAFCGNTFSWTTPFADANYSLVCSTQNGTLFLAAINNKTAAGATPIVELTPGNSAAANTEIDCVGIHD